MLRDVGINTTGQVKVLNGNSNEPSPKHNDESVHKSKLLPDGLNARLKSRNKAQTQSQPLGKRDIKKLDTDEVKPTCCIYLSEEASYLSDSIQRVANEVSNGNFGAYKEQNKRNLRLTDCHVLYDRESYRCAVDHLLNAISLATLDNIGKCSPKSSFTGNLRMNSRFPPLHCLLEHKRPDLRETLRETLSGIREFVYFLDREDQERIYNYLTNKL